MKWKTLKSKYVFEGIKVKVRQDRCKLPDKKEIDFYVVEIPDFVTVLALTENKKIVLVKQYRHALGKDMLQLPAGFLNHNEQPLQAIKREFREETGMKLTRIKKLGTWSTMPGKGSQKMTAYVGSAIKSKGGTTDKDIEEIGLKLLFKSPNEVLQMMRNGKIWSASYIAVILAAKEKYPHLFK